MVFPKFRVKMAIPAKTEGLWERLHLLKFTHKLHVIKFLCMREIETWFDKLEREF